MKEIIKSSLIGIGIAVFIFCVIGVMIDLGSDGEFILTGYYFSKMVAACIITGIGFGAPTCIYQNDKVPMVLKCVIHMGTGCVIYTIAAFWAGWIPMNENVGMIALCLAGELLVAFLIWFGFFMYYKNLAKKINLRIKEMNECD